MTRRAILLPFVAALAAARPAAGGETVWVHYLDEGLRVRSAASWDAGGALHGGVHVLPSGELLALVVPQEGIPRLVRWDAAGKEQARHDVDLPRTIRAARLASDGTLLVLTEDSLARVRASDGTVSRRRPLGAAVGAASVAAAPDGAWLVSPERVAWEGLDGARSERAAPLGAASGRRNALAGLLVNGRNECLVAEQRTTEHVVKGRPASPDLTTERVLTLLAPAGEVVSTAALGEARTRREWFWSEKAPESTVPVPREAGLVRTRWDGTVEIEAWTESADGGFVLVLREKVGESGERRSVIGLDRGLRERWSRPYGGDLARAMSPPSDSGFLVYSGPGHVWALEERGKAERPGFFGYPGGAHPSPDDGVAVGRAPDGWIVVEWTRPRGTP